MSQQRQSNLTCLFHDVDSSDKLDGDHTVEESR